MNVKVTEESAERVRVALSGMLDLDGVQAIDAPIQKIVDGPQSFVVLDLSAVDYIASMGLAMLVETHNAIRARGGCMAVLDPKPDVEKILRSFSIDRLIPIAHGEKEAAMVEKSECQTR